MTIFNFSWYKTCWISHLPGTQSPGLVNRLNTWGGGSPPDNVDRTNKRLQVFIDYKTSMSLD